MNEILPFLLAHWPLSLAFLVTLAAIIFHDVTNRHSSGKQVNCAELTRLMNNEKAVVVDVRGAEDFQQGHILGALNITPETMKDHQATLRKASSRPIVLVDKNGTGLGPMIKLFAQEGWQVAVLSGGLNSWRSEGLPLTTANE